MFHVMLVLPALALFGVMAVFVLAAPFCVGGVLAALLGLFGQTRLVRSVPAILGVVGLVCSLYFFSPAIPVNGILIYWAVFFLWIWLIFLVAGQIRQAIGRWRGER